MQKRCAEYSLKGNHETGWVLFCWIELVQVKKPYPRPLSTLHLFPSCMTHRRHPSPKCSPDTAISSHGPTTFCHECLNWLYDRTHMDLCLKLQR